MEVEGRKSRAARDLQLRVERRIKHRDLREHPDKVGVNAVHRAEAPSRTPRVFVKECGIA